MKRVFKGIGLVVLVLVLAVGGLLGWLTATEYDPPAEEPARVLSDGATESLRAGEELSILSWNIGYAGLGSGSDFFMDGGKNARAADEATVERYLSGIAETLRTSGCGLVLLQEVDSDSARTYAIDETAALARGSSFYALNYSCPFVPIPIPPLGRVNSGLMSISDYAVAQAERLSLPCPFSWPLRIANLKRCLLVTRLDVAGTERQLVLVNLHLEAYDDGAGKLAQTQQLRDFLQREYEKGNYVIAGGDFNQVFPGALEAYPNAHPELWQPGTLDESLLPAGAGWRYAYSLDAPSCRLLNQPYDPADREHTQYYVIDGFILSPNVTLLEVETLGELDFADSDHNPVRVRLRLD